MTQGEAQKQNSEMPFQIKNQTSHAPTQHIFGFSSTSSQWVSKTILARTAFCRSPLHSRDSKVLPSIPPPTQNKVQTGPNSALFGPCFGTGVVWKGVPYKPLIHGDPTIFLRLLFLEWLLELLRLCFTCLSRTSCTGSVRSIQLQPRSQRAAARGNEYMGLQKIQSMGARTADDTNPE